MKKTGVIELENRIKKLGRTWSDKENGIIYFNWTCSGLEFTFHGTCLTASFFAEAGIEMDPLRITGGVEKKRLVWPWLAVFLDDEEKMTCSFELSQAFSRHLIFQSDEPETHRIRIVKLTENLKTSAGITGFYMEGEILEKESCKETRRIEFIGDSITCGFGNDTTEKDRLFFSEEENGWFSHGAVAARKLHMDWGVGASKKL